jgi:hypothetical protein
MKLRTHPLSYHGAPNWPPVWTRIEGQEKHPVGEVGILEEVRRSALDDTCYLIIQYEGSRYMGKLAFDDQKLCDRLCNVLTGHCGRPIREIADLDIHA